MSADHRIRRRSRRRERRHRERVSEIIKMTQPVHKLPVYSLVSEESIELIHEKTLEILEEVGIDFYLEESRQILREHGADVRGQTVHFDPALIQEYVAKAPSKFTLLARNPENNLSIGDDNLVFAPVYGPPFVHDHLRGRRKATLEDFQNFVKLAYSSPYIHCSGGTVVEPNDISVDYRHLDMLYSHIKYSDKAFMGSVTSGENAADSVKMAELVFTKDRIRRDPALISIINASSPRRFDERMLEALTIYTRARQASIVSPFILLGAMAPVSLAGALIQQNAEALAGIAYSQMVEPGAPVVYGSFLTNVDLKSGSPVFGSPESQLALFTSAQLARRYGLPFRSGGMFASSKVPDSQAAYESVMTILPAVQAHTNFVLHAAGWLENGLSAGYEKFVLDCEVLGMLHTYMEGLDMSAEGLAMESLYNVEPGGHHLNTPHTMEHYKTAFYRSELFDYLDFEQWTDDGSQNASTRATSKYQEILASYEKPALEPGIEESLQEFISQRKAEITG